MKIQINFKSPDSVEDAIEDCAADHDESSENIRKALGKFIKYGEYCLVEFDLEAGTAKVVPVKMKLFEVHSDSDGSLNMIRYTNELEAYGMSLEETIAALELLVARAYEKRAKIEEAVNVAMSRTQADTLTTSDY